MASTTARRTFSVGIFARHAGRVLLIRHRRLGTWLPVGGEIEPGESPLDAARRELLEETGLVGVFPLTAGVDGSPAGLIGYEEHPAGSKGVHLNFCFVADVPTDVVVPNDEFDDHRWVSDAAAVECPPNVRQLVSLALAAGAPGPDALVALAERWLHTFNTRDLDGLLALYADDAVHVSPKLRDRHPETRGEIRGKAALRTWWADAMQRLPDLRYEARQLVANGSCVFMDYDRLVPGEPVLRVAESLHVRAGLIVASHVFHG
jgi:8-oxo-dGTP pyrophosphatase MutT (NUDIX family)